MSMDTTEDVDVDTNLPWHVQKIPFVPIRLARPRILHESKLVFLDRRGTYDHEQPRSVPLVPMPLGALDGVKTRPDPKSEVKVKRVLLPGMSVRLAFSLIEHHYCNHHQDLIKPKMRHEYVLGTWYRYIYFPGG